MTGRARRRLTFPTTLRMLLPLALLASLALASASAPDPASASPPESAPASADDAVRPLPEFTETRAERWINSEPLTVEALRGRVALVEFWTFGCGNCVRSVPWVESLVERYAERGLVVVGVHTPEFDHERIVERVKRFVDDHGIDHPVVIDNDMDYWRRLGNRYWPAFYLVDRAGRIRHVHIGETHAGSGRAASVEKMLEALLDEPGPRAAP